jgi:hypothetical protein
MRSTTNAPPHDLPDTTPTRSDRNSTTAAAGVSLPRLYLLRLGYLVVAVGLALTKWPLLVNHDVPWPLFEGLRRACWCVVAPSLPGAALSAANAANTAFELGWKFIWSASSCFRCGLPIRWIRPH